MLFGKRDIGIIALVFGWGCADYVEPVRVSTVPLTSLDPSISASVLGVNIGSDRVIDRLQEVSFSAETSGSELPLLYSWQFGDGQSVSGREVSHRFENPGHYLVRVTVRDSQGNSGSDDLDIEVKLREKVAVWLELSLPTEKLENVLAQIPEGADSQMTIQEYGLRALEYFSQVTDLAIIETRPWNVPELFPYLMENKPRHLKIIGGMKTIALPGMSPFNPNCESRNFADSVGWSEIANFSRAIVETTGVNIVLLDNEPALECFHNNAETISESQLFTAMAPLRESGILFWSGLPAIQRSWSGATQLHEKTVTLVSAYHQALPNNVFLTAYESWSDPYYWHSELQAEMIAVVGEDHVLGGGKFSAFDGFWDRTDSTPAELANPFLNDTPAFSPEQIWQLMQNLPEGQQMRIYPIFEDYIRFGRSLAEIGQ